MTRTRYRRRLGLVGVFSLVGLTSIGCSEDSEADGSGPDAGAEGYPVTITNCGNELTFEAAPDNWSSATRRFSRPSPRSGRRTASPAICPATSPSCLRARQTSR